MGDVDELYVLRNHYYIGNYSACVAEGSSLNPRAEETRVQRDVLVYRAYIAMGNASVVLDEISDNTVVDLQAVKLLATYTSQPDSRELALATLKEWTNDGVYGSNATLQLVAGMIYAREGEMKDALRSLRLGSTLEQVALTIQLYLKLDRVDLAEKQLKQMQEEDDDSTLTQLAMAWVSIAVGGPRYQEAAYIYQELMDKFSSSVMLLNGKACALMHMKRFGDAEKLLLEAMALSSAEPDTLVNLISVSHNLSKPAEAISRYMRQLEDLSANHAEVKSRGALLQTFDKISSNYSPEVTA